MISRKQRILLWGLAGLVPAAMVVAVVLGTRDVRPTPPVDVAELTVGEIAAGLKSGEFAALPAADRRAAIDRLAEDPAAFREMMEDPKLGEEQRTRLEATLRDTFREAQRAQIREFFALPVAEREAYLDRQIDEMAENFRRWQEERAAAGPPREGGAGQREERPRGPTAAWIRERIDSSSPAERAQRAEYRRLMHERMAARGMSGPRGPR